MTRSLFWFLGFPGFLLLFSSLLTTFISMAAIPRFGWDLESTTSSTALSWLRSSSSSSSTPKFNVLRMFLGKQPIFLGGIQKTSSLNLHL
ncbi:hypothetical protein Q3G72_013276 [Acer saccharum]|nr:hypothetical protein Q3G72_013276 [Acer saccharum]